MTVAAHPRLFGRSFDDFYRVLRSSDFGHELPDFEQCVRPALLDDPLIAHAPYTLYVADFARQRLCYMSENAEQIFGYPAAWFLEGGIPRLFSLIHPDDEPISTQIGLDYIRERDARVPPDRRAEHYWTIAVRIRHAEGHYFWLLVQYAPIHITDTGRVLYALGMAFDATQFYRFPEPTGSLVYPDANGRRVTVTLPVRERAPDDLTQRELEVLQLVARGLTSVQIAERLHISKTTVDTHRRNILSKTGLSNSVEMTNLALSLGLV